MKRIETSAAICVSILWLISDLAIVQASEQDTAYPHTIVCEVKGLRYFLYLDHIAADGRAVYQTPSGKATALIEGGVVSRVAAIPGSCAGKTVEELVANGQAHFLWN